MGRRPKVSRDEVLTAARKLFAERGYDGTTLAAIAASLEISPAALLRHAAGKQELFAAAMAPAHEIRLPIEFLAELPGDVAPRPVLRRIGEAFVPFIEARLDEQISRWMRARTLEEARLTLPFDLDRKPTPPQRALALVEGWLTRAVAAGRLRLADPRAAALMLLASLHAYVALHRIVRILEPPLPLDRYLDTVTEVWRGIETSPQGAGR